MENFNIFDKESNYYFIFNADIIQFRMLSDKLSKCEYTVKLIKTNRLILIDWYYNSSESIVHYCLDIRLKNVDINLASLGLILDNSETITFESLDEFITTINEIRG